MAGGCVKYRMPGTQVRTAISVSYRLSGTLEHRSFDGFPVSTSRIKSRSTADSSPLSMCHQHSCQCKCCNLRTSNATLAADLNTRAKNRRRPNCFLTSMFIHKQMWILLGCLHNFNLIRDIFLKINA